MLNFGAVTDSVGKSFWKIKPPDLLISHTLKIGIFRYFNIEVGSERPAPVTQMYLDQVILVSTVPSDSLTSISTSNTYKHTPQNSRPQPKNNNTSSINSGSESIGQIYQLELGASETFGVKITPFTYKDASIPPNCLTSFSASAFSNDANLLAYHPTLSALFVYAAGKDRPVSRSFGHERIIAMQASPCGRFLLAGTESGCLILWRIGSGDLISVIEGAHFQSLRVIRFSPDGQTVATGASDALIKIWSWSDLSFSDAIKRPEPLFTFSQHSAPITDLVFSLTSIGYSRGRLLSASLDGNCNFYDLVDGQLLLNFTIPVAVSAAALNATETAIYAAGVDGNIYTLALNGNNSSNTLQVPLQLHKGPISCLKWSLDERVLISAGAEDGQVAFWDAQSHQLLKSVQLTSKKVGCTNILVFGKSDPLYSLLESNYSTSQLQYAPFKRIGNPIANLAASSLILPIPLCTPKSCDSSISAENKEKIKELLKENEQLRAINSELCSIACEHMN